MAEKRDKVAFTLADAKRIAKAVRRTEGGDRNSNALNFGFRPFGEEGGGELRLCKTTAEWLKDTSQTVDVWEDVAEGDEAGDETESSGETVEAYNKLGKVRADCWVLVGKAKNGLWYLVADASDCDPNSMLAERLTEDGFTMDSSSGSVREDGTDVQLLINNGGCCKWVKTEKIDVIVGASMVGTTMTFEKKEIIVFRGVADPEADEIVAEECSVITGVELAAEGLVFEKKKVTVVAVSTETVDPYTVETLECPSE